MQSGHWPRATLLILIFLLAFGLRLVPWGHSRFLEDEALYAFWGMQIATGADPLLDQEPVDKPPLHPYLIALSYTLLGVPASAASGTAAAFEAAARLPSLMASTLGVPLVYALARRTYGNAQIGLLGALLVALSPFDLLFALTAFTDPLMTALGTASLVAAVSQRFGAFGLLAGLSFASKQQGLLFLPLGLALGLLTRPPLSLDSLAGHEGSAEPSRLAKAVAHIHRSPWLRTLSAFAVVSAATLWWDSARLQRPGFLGQSLISYGGLGAAPTGELFERAVEWLKLLAQFWPSPGLAVLVAITISLAVARRRRLGSVVVPLRSDLLLAMFVAAFLALHWLANFQVWDRYLLPLVPLVAVLVARALSSSRAAIASARGRCLYAAALLALVPGLLIAPIAAAVQGHLAVGGDQGAYDGIDVLAAYMTDQLPSGAVLYHSWLGHHYRFYLYNIPLRLHWYPDLADLIRDAKVYCREPRYIAFPSWRDSAAMERGLNLAGITLVPRFETARRDGTVSFRLFELQGP